MRTIAVPELRITPSVVLNQQFAILWTLRYRPVRVIVSDGRRQEKLIVFRRESFAIGEVKVLRRRENIHVLQLEHGLNLCVHESRQHDREYYSAESAEVARLSPLILLEPHREIFLKLINLLELFANRL